MIAPLLKEYQEKKENLQFNFMSPSPLKLQKVLLWLGMSNIHIQLKVQVSDLSFFQAIPEYKKTTNKQKQKQNKKKHPLISSEDINDQRILQSDESLNLVI